MGSWRMPTAGRRRRVVSAKGPVRAGCGQGAAAGGSQQVLTLEGRQEHHEILLENLRLSQDGLSGRLLTRRLQEQETQMQAVRQEIAAHEGRGGASVPSGGGEPGRAERPTDPEARSPSIKRRWRRWRRAGDLTPQPPGVGAFAGPDAYRPGRTGGAAGAVSAGPMRKPAGRWISTGRRRKSCGPSAAS